MLNSVTFHLAPLQQSVTCTAVTSQWLTLGSENYLNLNQNLRITATWKDTRIHNTGMKTMMVCLRPTTSKWQSPK